MPKLVKGFSSGSSRFRFEEKGCQCTVTLEQIARSYPKCLVVSKDTPEILVDGQEKSIPLLELTHGLIVNLALLPILIGSLLVKLL